MAAAATHPPAVRYRTPRPLRRALVALAALVALFMVAQGTISLLDLAARHTSTETTSYRDVSRLVIDDSSDVRLTSAPAGSPLEVNARVTEGLSSPTRDAEQGADGELRLSSSCPIFFSGSCGVDYDVRVPAGTAIRVETSAGDVTAEDLSSDQPVTLSTSAGDVDVLGVTAPSLRIDTSAGDIDARGIRSRDVRADTSAGDVRLSLEAPLERVETSTSAGDVNLVVPDVAYDVHTETSAGDTDTSGLQTSRSAAASISAVTSAGDIRIEPRR
jgi:hypothetical protein